MFLTRAAVRNPILVLMVCIAAVVLSQIALARLPVDLFPNITVPAITVATGYSGASPEDVERAVTYPLEQAVTRVAGVQQILSTSRRGASTVQVWFDWGTDLNVPEVEIIQNVQRIARSLPDGVTQPSVLKFDISNIPVAQVVVSAPGMDARQLYQLATDTIEPQLERLPGVSTAFVNGGLVRQFNINVDPQRLAAVGLSLPDVDNAVRRYNALLPSGSLRNSQIDFQLKVPTLLRDVTAIRQVVLTSKNGVAVHIADIADVADAAADQTQIVKVNGQPGITMGVVRQPSANIVGVVNALRAALPRLTGLPPGVAMRIAFDQSTYIRAAIQSLTREALIGGFLTFVVILVFLPNLWNLFIIGIGLPLSVATYLGDRPLSRRRDRGAGEYHPAPGAPGHLGAAGSLRRDARGRDGSLRLDGDDRGRLLPRRVLDRGRPSALRADVSHHRVRDVRLLPGLDDRRSGLEPAAPPRAQARWGA